MNLHRMVVIAALFGAFALFGLAPAQAAKARFTMVISHLGPEDLTNNEMHPAMKHFESMVEARTGGEIDVQVFGNGQLGSEVETARQAQAGRTVQATLISSGAMSFLSVSSETWRRPSSSGSSSTNTPKFVIFVIVPSTTVPMP